MFVKGKDLVKNFVDIFTSFEAVFIGVCDILSSQQRTLRNVSDYDDVMNVLTVSHLLMYSLIVFCIIS